jgi:hypothetical protein
MNLVAVLHLAVALIAIALSVPLIRRKIPMNDWYGMRIPAAFESDERWYEINAYGGRILLGWGVGVALIAGAGLLLERRHWVTYAWAALLVMLAGLGFAVSLVQRRAERNRPAPLDPHDAPPR